MDAVIPDDDWVDPSEPFDMSHLMEHFDAGRGEGSRNYRAIVGMAGLTALLSLFVAWQWTPLGEAVDADAVRRWVLAASASPWAPAWVIGMYVLAGIVAFPVTVLIVATAVVFGPAAGFLLGLAGSVANALFTYWLGAELGRDRIRKWAGDRLNRVSKRLAKQGALTIATLRIVPVAPFTVVNLAAGASHIRFRDYALGTVLGMAPGTLVIALFGDGLQQTIRAPSLWNVLIPCLALGSLWLRRRTGDEVSLSGDAKPIGQGQPEKNQK